MIPLWAKLNKGWKAIILLWIGIAAFMGLTYLFGSIPFFVVIGAVVIFGLSATVYEQAMGIHHWTPGG